LIFNRGLGIPWEPSLPPCSYRFFSTYSILTGRAGSKKGMVRGYSIFALCSMRNEYENHHSCCLLLHLSSPCRVDSFNFKSGDLVKSLVLATEVTEISEKGF
jgi:hypothetical protein